MSFFFCAAFPSSFLCILFFVFFFDERRRNTITNLIRLFFILRFCFFMLRWSDKVVRYLKRRGKKKRGLKAARELIFPQQRIWLIFMCFFLCVQSAENSFFKKNPRFRKCYVLREELPLVFLFVLLRFLSNDVGTTSFSSLSPFFRWFILLWPLVYIFFFWRSISFLVATILRSCEVVQVIRAPFFFFFEEVISIYRSHTDLSPSLWIGEENKEQYTNLQSALFFFFAPLHSRTGA